MFPGGAGIMDHHLEIHGRPARAKVPHDGQRQHQRHDKGHRHAGQEFHQVKRISGGSTDGLGEQQ